MFVIVEIKINLNLKETRNTTSSLLEDVNLWQKQTGQREIPLLRKVPPRVIIISLGLIRLLLSCARV